MKSMGEELKNTLINLLFSIKKTDHKLVLHLINITYEKAMDIA